MTETGGSAQAEGVEASAGLSDPFRELFDDQFDYVRRVLQRLGVRPGDVDDVAQELFLAVHKALPTYDPVRPIRPWLCGFGVRFAANYRRLSRLAEAPIEPFAESSRAPGTDHEARDLVLKLLDQLDFDRRTIVVMHDLEGFGVPEIAFELGVPLNTVYSRLRLARESLRIAVEQLVPSGGAS